MMDFKDFIRCYHLPSIEDEGIALGEIRSLSLLDASSLLEFSGFHLMVFVITGEMEVEVMGKRYRLCRDCFMDVMHPCSHSLLSMSGDLHAFVLAMTGEYEAVLAKHLSWTAGGYALSRMENPVVPVDVSELARFVKNMYIIKRAFYDTANRFRISILKHYIWIFYAETVNILTKGAGGTEEETPMADRKRMLFVRFIDVLPQHVREKRSIDFYASLLCVSSQYLGRVVKEFSRKTVYAWITEYLLLEVTKMLEETSLSIQQISDELNFSDQAVLTRLFKKHKGVSPLQYRNGLVS